jgi:hypothetical protein
MFRPALHGTPIIKVQQGWHFRTNAKKWPGPQKWPGQSGKQRQIGRKTLKKLVRKIFPMPERGSNALTAVIPKDQIRQIRQHRQQCRPDA